MVKYFCDRCKINCTDDMNHGRTIHLKDVFETSNTIVYNGNTELLLCNKCAHDYYDFLRGDTNARRL